MRTMMPAGCRPSPMTFKTPTPLGLMPHGHTMVRRVEAVAGVALDAVRLWARHGCCNGGDMHRASAKCDARSLGRRDATAPRAAGALAGLLCPEPMSARRSLPCCGGHRGVSPPRVHAPRLWSRRSSLRRVASALLVFCGAEQRVDQRAERHGPYRIHRTLPASLVTETAEAGILIGLEGRGKTGLSYRFGHLHVYVHAFCAPFRHAPHRQVCRTEAPHTSSAGSRCPCSVSARRTDAIPRPSCNGPSLRACAEASTPER